MNIDKFYKGFDEYLKNKDSEKTHISTGLPLLDMILKDGVTIDKITTFSGNSEIGNHLHDYIIHLMDNDIKDIQIKRYCQLILDIKKLNNKLDKAYNNFVYDGSISFEEKYDDIITKLHNSEEEYKKLRKILE